ncbi:MAG: hypothetical protein Q7I93_03840 [Syntrophales bacterium]|nr:hypothetical protein [Syntrophales bacterium]
MVFMEKERAESARRAKEDLEKIKKYQAVTEEYRKKHLNIHGNWEKELGKYRIKI